MRGRPGRCMRNRLNNRIGRPWDFDSLLQPYVWRREGQLVDPVHPCLLYVFHLDDHDWLSLTETNKMVGKSGRRRCGCGHCRTGMVLPALL